MSFFSRDLRVLAKKLANRLATQRKSLRKFNLRLLATPFGQALCALGFVTWDDSVALTLVKIKFSRKSKHAFHRLATQPKSTQVE